MSRHGRTSARQSFDDEALAAEAAGAPGTRLLEFEDPADSTTADASTDESNVGSDSADDAREGAEGPLAQRFSPYVGVRVFTDGMTKDYEPSLAVVVAARITLAVYCGWMNLLILLMLLCWLHPAVIVVVACVWATIWLPAKPLYWRPFISSRLFELWRRYTHFSYLFEEPLDLSRRYIFAQHPHGTFPLAPVLANTLCTQLFPKWPVYAIAASAVFNIPMWRHFLTWFGSLPATAKNFHHLLRHCGTVSVLPGGVAEMYMADPHKERIKLLNRKGFVRVAIEEGISIVPMYYFGNSGLLNFGPTWLAGVSRRCKTSIGILYGICYLPIPHRVPVFLAVGRPLAVRRMARDEAGFEAHVAEVHAQYVSDLQGLYNRHKGAYGWGDRPLSIE